MKKISILIPTIRPQNLPKLKHLILENAHYPAELIEILTIEDRNREGCPKTLKRLVAQATHNIVVFLGDDTEPRAGWLNEAWKVMKTFPDKVGMVGLNDLHHDGNKLATHWMAHKKLLKNLDGEFFHTGYVHTWCDAELTERCKQMRKYKWAERAVIKHNHPIIQNDIKLVDADYARVYSDENRNADQKLFMRRKFNNWKTPQQHTGKPKATVAIGIPAAGDGKARFWTCLEMLRYFSLQNGIDTLRQRRQCAVVSHARNVIVADTLRDFPLCSHILFIDDDQVFPQDLLLRLLSHDKDIVVCNIHRKASPYIPVVSVNAGGGDIFHPIYVRPSEGSLQKVTSAGTGVALIRKSVFEKLEFPWFMPDYLPVPKEEQKQPGLIRGHMFIGEDNRFFVLAKNAGFDIWCDFSIEIGHIGDYEVTWRDHERAMADGERIKSDHADAGSVDRGERDQLYDQSGAARRMPEDSGNAQLPADGVQHDAHGQQGRPELRVAV